MILLRSNQNFLQRRVFNMKHKGLVFALMLSALIASVGLSGCATYGGLSRETPYSLNLDSEDLIYGDIITYDKVGKVGKKIDSLESLKALTVAEALQKYRDFDMLLFPQYVIKYQGKKVTVTVTGRLAKVKTAN